MTREEAIEVLENGEWWEELAEWYMIVHPEHDKLHDAVDMAISALRQQEGKDTYAPTNADHIRSMTDEELADFLNQWGTSTRAWQKDPGETLYWLQQPVEEDDHD